MDVLTAVAPVFGTNCYLVIADDGVSCVIADVGAGIATRVRTIVDSLGLRPAAVLATHGHVDHTWGAAEVSAAYGVPVLLHAADAYRLADPFGSLGLGVAGDGTSHDPGGPLAQAIAAAGISPASYRAPAVVETFGAAPDAEGPEVLELGGLLFAGSPLTALHAPGHTQGATLYVVDGVAGPTTSLPFAPGEEDLAHGATRTALTGDVLFAGTIGRTDLPGGDGRAMAGTLGHLAGALTPGTILLPGHGPATRMDLELRRNPYLAG
ncbi:MBL fold metallo-hydrolase [Pengzhenrongella sicca]|uniref:MBL fold metallo-hydrolase n=1 Tax=Pengzhenrongella sicca TaxID=2819238 RepID=A0A8A4Z846_9MICO|nr:MBL fold metallo-hydrolase [Pengzhenrongella sicca]QTE28032.1 MBL fold metallo-hydrolase [Pengzhenrongella sicca]